MKDKTIKFLTKGRSREEAERAIQRFLEIKKDLDRYISEHDEQPKEVTK